MNRIMLALACLVTLSQAYANLPASPTPPSMQFKLSKSTVPTATPAPLNNAELYGNVRAATGHLDQGGDICESATVIPSLPYCNRGNTIGFNANYSEFANNEGDCLLYTTGPDVVYAYTSLVAEMVTVSLCGSSYDTGVHIWRGCPDSGESQLANCNDDNIACGGAIPVQSCCSFWAISGATYYIVVTGWSGDAGAYVLNVNNQGLCESCGDDDNCPPHDAVADLCTDAIPLGVPTIRRIGSTVGQGMGMGEAPRCDLPPFRSPFGVWFTVVGTDHMLTASTCNPCTVGYCRSCTDFNTNLRILEGECGYLSCVASNDNFGWGADGCMLSGYGEAVLSRVSWCAEANVTYFIVISSSDAYSQQGTFELSLWEAEYCGPCTCDYPNQDEPFEPGNDCCECLPFVDFGQVTCGDSLCGEIGPTDTDVDFYYFEVPGPGASRVTIDVFGNDTPGWCPFGGGLNPSVQLIAFGGCTPVLYEDEDGGVGADSRLVIDCSGQGGYLLRIASASGTSGPYIIATSCAPCCENQPIMLDAQGGAAPWFWCLDLCPGNNTVCLGPLAPNQMPISSVNAGCISEMAGCITECLPAILDVVSGWYYNQATANWCFDVNSQTLGCCCLSIDGILPVRLITHEAIVSDQAVTLRWETASEVDNDHFDIRRGSSLVGRVNANGGTNGATYNWTEYNLTNGTEYTYSVSSVDINGASEILFTINATPSMMAATVTEFALCQNYPNPFNPETAIRFDLAEASAVQLVVFNIAGQQVAELVNSNLPSGAHTVNFDASHRPSGVYLYRLIAGSFSLQRKMVLLK